MPRSQLAYLVIPMLALPLAACGSRAAPTESVSQATAATSRPDAGLGHDLAPVAARPTGARPETDPLRFAYYGLPQSDPTAAPLLVLFNDGYVVGYDNAHHRTVWVAYRLSAVPSPAPRHRYRPADPAMPAGIVADSRATAPELSKLAVGGKENGHGGPITWAPTGGIAESYGAAAGDQTRYGTDIIPQDIAPGDPWWAATSLEPAYAKAYGEIWVMTGPVGEDANGPTWKIQVTIQQGRTAVQAFIFPHQGAGDPASCLTTAAVISARTGLTFFSDFHDLDHDRRSLFAHRRFTTLWPTTAAPGAPVANQEVAAAKGGG